MTLVALLSASAVRRRLRQCPVLAQQLTLAFLDALAVCTRGLGTGARVLGMGQRGRATGPPLVQIDRLHAVLAAPGAFARFAHRRRGDRGIKPGARSPGPALGRPGLRILAPALQGFRTNTNLARHHFQCCALRRQQFRYRSALECLSVSS